MHTCIPTCTTNQLIHQFLQLHSRETMVNAFWKKRGGTRRFGSKYSQRNIQKFRNKKNNIGLYMSHFILQTSRRGWALVISKTLIYSVGSPDSSKERRSGWGRMEMRRNKKRIASGKNSIHVHSKHPFRSCLHRWPQYFQGHYQLLGFCSAPGEAWREWKLGVNFQLSWEIQVVLQ
jgi:hypothetical protein